MNRSITGVILAGGTGKRFGGISKANLRVGGKPIILRILETISDLFEEIIIVTNTPAEFPEYTCCRIIGDELKNKGPLGGIHAALKASANEAVFVLAGDMPFPDKELINYLIGKFQDSRCQILVPQVNNKIEPLHAIYKTSVREDIEMFISGEKNHAIQRFLKIMNTCYVELEETPRILTAFTNINNPSDLNRLNTWGSE